jgi:PAS domain S-box-containing protein
LSPYLEGETPHALATIRDISERKNLDEARRESERQKEIAEERARAAQTLAAKNEALRAIFETCPLGMIIVTEEGIVDRWNRVAENIYGYRAEEVIGTSIWDIAKALGTGGDSPLLAVDGHGKRIREVKDLRGQRRKKDGQVVDISVSTAQFYDANGGNSGFVFLVDDVTERKATEQQLRQSQKMEAIGQLTGGIAHDFNNLLGVTLGNLELLEGFVNPRDVKVLKHLQTAQKAALRGADLTRRLLAFSRSGELRPTATSLQASIQNMIDLAARAIGPEIKIGTRFDPKLAPVFVDSAGLESALLNLVVNARDAMPKGGSITITTQFHTVEESHSPIQTGELKTGHYACVTISDTGHGMPREVLERVFEPFFTTKPRDKGTGLGLAMVYGFVKQSGGTVRIYSEPGYGTTVSFYLPLAEGFEESRSAPKVGASVKGEGIVLVVDDEDDLLDIAVAYLAEMGYEALQATDGLSALELVKQRGDIDLMVTDIIMPGGMNGVELTQKVHDLRPEIKVVYCSGFPADALAERSMPLMEGPLLRKPYQRTDFTAMVRDVMEKRSDYDGLNPARPASNA